ncbi:MAG: hypothetical protein ACYTBZ_04200 [Planctomycetota bacterium]|jgi:hypothetical protein
MFLMFFSFCAWAILKSPETISLHNTTPIGAMISLSGVGSLWFSLLLIVIYMKEKYAFHISREGIIFHTLIKKHNLKWNDVKSIIVIPKTIRENGNTIKIVHSCRIFDINDGAFKEKDLKIVDVIKQICKEEENNIDIKEGTSITTEPANKPFTFESLPIISFVTILTWTTMVFLVITGLISKEFWSWTKILVLPFMMFIITLFIWERYGNNRGKGKR